MEQAQLLEKTQIVSDMVQQAIRENVHLSPDQSEYQKHYESLVERFEAGQNPAGMGHYRDSEKTDRQYYMNDFLTVFARFPEALT